MKKNAVVVHIDFEICSEPQAYIATARPAAEMIAEVEGLIWKIWTIDESTRRAGGTYLFTDEMAARRYLEGPIVAGLRTREDVRGVTASVLPVLEEPTSVTFHLPAHSSTRSSSR